jgi:hypothetical protein
MKKKYLYLIILFLIFFSNFSLKAEWTPIKLSFTDAYSIPISTTTNINGLKIGMLSTAKKLKGIDIGAFGTSTDHLNGIQIAGFLSESNNLNGIQIGGFGWAISKHLNGIQIAGFTQSSMINGIEVGLMNLEYANYLDNMHSKDAKEMNIIGHDINGMQIYFIIGLSKKINGIEIVGLFSAAEQINGLQISTINMSNINGIQIGVWNIGARVNGLQLGIVNYAENLKGIQIGLINRINDKSKISRTLPIVNIGW